MADGKFVSYCRVSTAAQGVSGLGLEAQQAAVEHYLDGGDWQLVDAFVEVESTKRKRRPELEKALAACKRHRAILVIAKLDRLARNVHFVSGLMESGVDFVAVDNPHATKLMVHMLAAFAEHEWDQISRRTKEALAAAKARGVVLGSHGKVLAAENKAQAQAFAQKLAPVVQELRGEGHRSIRALTAELNRRGVPTPSGAGQWHIPTTHRLLHRLDRAG